MLRSAQSLDIFQVEGLERWKATENNLFEKLMQMYFTELREKARLARIADANRNIR